MRGAGGKWQAPIGHDGGGQVRNTLKFLQGSFYIARKTPFLCIKVHLVLDG